MKTRPSAGAALIAGSMPAQDEPPRTGPVKPAGQHTLRRAMQPALREAPLRLRAVDPAVVSVPLPLLHGCTRAVAMAELAGQLQTCNGAKAVLPLNEVCRAARRLFCSRKYTDAPTRARIRIDGTYGTPHPDAHKFTWISTRTRTHAQGHARARAHVVGSVERKKRKTKG